MEEQGNVIPINADVRYMMSLGKPREDIEPTEVTLARVKRLGESTVNNMNKLRDYLQSDNPAVRELAAYMVDQVTEVSYMPPPKSS